MSTMNDNFYVDLWNLSVLESQGYREKEPEMISCEDAMRYFFEPGAYELMRTAGQNRVQCFWIAVQQAFIREDTSDYADALREYAIHLANTGILLENLPESD